MDDDECTLTISRPTIVTGVGPGNCMYREMVSCMYSDVVIRKLDNLPKCNGLVIEPESTAKPSPSTRQAPKPIPKREKIEGESDETTRKTRQQINRLTERQRAILIKTFAELEKNPVKNALKIFVMLFSDVPHYKQIWPQFRAIPDSSLMNAIELRRHASVYMCGLGSIIHSMNRENDLAIQMNRIAKAHIKWNIHRIHIVHMLEPVLAVVRECNDDIDDEAIQAWTTLYHIIADLIEIYRNKIKTT
ncbi:globin [Teladorsagia circumcincta]|uniref:Globin n=1 Tax=Teladorsagia circumcincta TaxID=45464 RepID=A0A2G9UPT0_TELCI|nr:globin [Teladorsagia circumcincta]